MPKTSGDVLIVRPDPFLRGVGDPSDVRLEVMLMPEIER